MSDVKDTRELTKKSAQVIKDIAFDFNKVFFNTFNDYLYRAVIYSLPDEPNIIRIMCLISDDEGAWRKLIFEYDMIEMDNFSAINKDAESAFKNLKNKKIAETAFKKFLVRMVDTGIDISCIFVDLGDMIYNSSYYYSVSVGSSQIEDSCINIYIRAHSTQFKYINSFVTAKRLVGDLAEF